MKQIIQDLKSGATILEEVPVPQVMSGCVLIQTTRTLVSLGTERMLVEFSKASLFDKARQQPDKVKQTLDKIKTNGVLATLEIVKNKLDQPMTMGYCNVGKVVALGKGVTEFAIGDRVASNGKHAEYVCVPKNLVAKIPCQVTDDEATFTVIGSIGLQGIRLLQPQLGENIVIIGLGLIGLVAAQLLKAAGVRVIGVDFDQKKLDIATSYGIEVINPIDGTDQVKYVIDATRGVGADGVLITASAHTDDIIHNACEMSRKRGRIVLVGVIGLNIRRDDFYKKELTFQVSCSYGPGRYDEDYEAKGIDYPLPFVRWTEKRNFETVLQSIANGNLNVKPLITEEVELEDYNQIYGDMRKRGSIASIIKYPTDSKIETVVKVVGKNFGKSKGQIGIIGAGNYTGATMMPALKACKAQIKYIASAHGMSAKVMARKYGATMATSDYHEILNDPDIDLVIITTRHNLHAQIVVEALQAGKNVFVEKPLCLNEDELDAILDAYKAAEGKTLSVGFNRRFSPYAEKMRSLTGEGPKNIIATMNAGFISSEAWVHDLAVGGGRIIGEACHFIDLCSYLAGSKVVSVCMNSMGVNPKENTDNVSILLKYANGSNAVVNYFANGSKLYQKERIEVFAQEKTLILNNWKTLEGFGIKGFSKKNAALGKGHKEQFALLNERVINGGGALVDIDIIVNTTKASFACIESLKTKSWVDIK